MQFVFISLKVFSFQHDFFWRKLVGDIKCRALYSFFLKDQVLFRSWESIFGDEASTIRENVPIYSFDGRDILRDSAW